LLQVDLKEEVVAKFVLAFTWRVAQLEIVEGQMGTCTIHLHAFEFVVELKLIPFDLCL
jgi:hypothetical protein